MSKSKRKKLMLDRPTSHGGWPSGKNNSWIGDKPVNDIIYDYLESMGLTADVPHARLSESKIKLLIKKSLKEAIAAGEIPGTAVVSKGNIDSAIEYVIEILVKDVMNVINLQPKIKTSLNSLSEQGTKQQQAETFKQYMQLVLSLYYPEDVLRKNETTIREKVYEATLTDIDFDAFLAAINSKFLAFDIPDEYLARRHPTHWDSYAPGLSSLPNWERAIERNISKCVNIALKTKSGISSKSLYRPKKDQRLARKYQKQNRYSVDPDILFLQQRQDTSRGHAKTDKFFFFIASIDVSTVDSIGDVGSYDYNEESYRTHDYDSDLVDSFDFIVDAHRDIEITGTPGVYQVYNYVNHNDSTVNGLFLVSSTTSYATQEQILNHFKASAINEADYDFRIDIEELSDYFSFEEIFSAFSDNDVLEGVLYRIAGTDQLSDLLDVDQEMRSNFEKIIASDRNMGYELAKTLISGSKGLMKPLYDYIVLQSFEKTSEGINFDKNKYAEALDDITIAMADEIGEYLDAVINYSDDATEEIKQFLNVF